MRAIEDAFQSIGMGPADGLTIVPLEPGDVDELGIRFKDRGQTVRVAVIPRVGQDLRDTLGCLKGKVLHAHDLIPQTPRSDRISWLGKSLLW